MVSFSTGVSAKFLKSCHCSPSMKLGPHPVDAALGHCPKLTYRVASCKMSLVNTRYLFNRGGALTLSNKMRGLPFPFTFTLFRFFPSLYSVNHLSILIIFIFFSHIKILNEKIYLSTFLPNLYAVHCLDLILLIYLSNYSM